MGMVPSGGEVQLQHCTKEHFHLSFSVEGPQRHRPLKTPTAFTDTNTARATRLASQSDAYSTRGLPESSEN